MIKPFYLNQTVENKMNYICIIINKK